MDIGALWQYENRRGVVGGFDTPRCGSSAQSEENMQIDSTFQNEKRRAMQNEFSPSLFCGLYLDLVALFMWHHACPIGQ
jgi:hypothetical protein